MTANRNRLAEAGASRGEFGDGAVAAAEEAGPGWRADVRASVFRAWHAGSDFGYESRLLEERAPGGMTFPVFAETAASSFRAAFIRKGGPYGPAILALLDRMSPADREAVYGMTAGTLWPPVRRPETDGRLPRTMPEALRALALADPRDIAAAAAGLDPDSRSRLAAAIAFGKQESSPLRCPRCGHAHDGEFLCEEDCAACALQAEAEEDGAALGRTCGTCMARPGLPCTEVDGAPLDGAFHPGRYEPGPCEPSPAVLPGEAGPHGPVLPPAASRGGSGSEPYDPSVPKCVPCRSGKCGECAGKDSGFCACPEPVHEGTLLEAEASASGSFRITGDREEAGA